LLWLPFVGHIALTTYLGGYMPTYFMLPLGPALALPASLVLTEWLKAVNVRLAAPARLSMATGILSGFCLFIAISAVALFRDTHGHELIQRAIQEQVPPGKTLDIVGLWSASRTAPTPGPDGRTIDRRPLYMLMQAPEAGRPEYALIAMDTEKWTEEIPERPARAALLKADTNFDYSGFRNFDALGYHLSGTTKPTLPVWVFPRLIAGSHAYIDGGVDVYRLQPGATEAQHDVTALR
jgi:hypothetical protein